MSLTTENLNEPYQEFRDHISTVDQSGKRIWIYPRKPAGPLHNWRIIVAILLLAILFGLPFIKVDGHPYMLFNFFERKFIVFGSAFWPQDFHLFLLGTITFFIFVILFTMVFGRIWCGWACPQTIFMELVFRKIEYWIEGDSAAQRKLNQQRWSREKIYKKTAKHIIFILISVLIGHALMSYLVGIEEVWELATASPANNPGGFISLILFSGLFYSIFAFFREQACTVVCPYGRLQGVLLGKSSIVVAYDWKRGEPRGKIKKADNRSSLGDCIDCKRCVQVCPTGIDIRNGAQLECVNCTACIDACNYVMAKTGFPKGLIRYASFESIEKGVKKLFNARVAGYIAVLSLIVGALIYLLASRIEVETTVMRTPGMLYQEQPGGMISNIYTLKFINKTFEDIPITLDLKEAGGRIKRLGEDELIVPSNGSAEGIFMIEFPVDQIKKTRNAATIRIYRQGELIDEEKTNFIGPLN